MGNQGFGFRVLALGFRALGVVTYPMEKNMKNTAETRSVEN